MKRVAVDIGGTFTDVVYIDEDVMQRITDKVPSTPRDISQGVLEAVKKIKVDLSEVTLFVHGTTVGLNALLQGKGAKVSLITTRGFTDVLEMGRGDRKNLYDYLWKKPKPLVPRYLRLPLSERTNYLGEIIKTVDENEVKEIVRRFKKEGVEAIAVCLLHSYANPENERRVGKIIKEAWPEVTVALSHEVAREIREYERTSATVINAFIEKVVVEYLDQLNENLKNKGFRGQLLILSASGVLGIDAVKEKAIASLSSGPIGGASGAAYWARLCGVKDVLTMDVGGTSFDISVIKDGVNVERYEFELMGYPVPMLGIDVCSIGAGGGSIARVDAAGLLTVGPESAGADPGPMAYGKGGKEPTVTDAALVSSLINSNYFLGGEVPLDLDLAKKGVNDVGRKLGLSLNAAADGILMVARSNMSLSITEMLIGQGHDPREFAIIAYGGAGGIFASGIAKELSIIRVIIPPDPAVFSAQGILAMNLVHTYAQSYARSMDGLDIHELENIYRDMEKHALRILMQEGMSRKAIECVRSLDICYEGQRFQIETPVSNEEVEESTKVEIRNSFERLHESKYGYRMEAPLAVVNVRLKAIGRMKEMPVLEIKQGKEIPQNSLKGERKVYLEGNLVDTKIYERSGLLCGNTIVGPAIIEEPFHTTVVLSGQRLEVDRLGNLNINTGSA